VIERRVDGGGPPIVRDLGDRLRRRGGGGHEHQDVDPAEALDRGVDDVGGRATLVRAVGVSEDDVCAFAHVRVGDSAPHPVVSAAHGRHQTFESRHVDPLSRAPCRRRQR
jgi:hypothetical protein